MSDFMLTLRPDVVVTVMEDSAVLLNLETKYFYSVNPTGWAIVQMLENGASREQIRDKCLAWGALSEDLDKVERFLDAFESENLVTQTEGNLSSQDTEIKVEWSPPSLEKHKEPLEKIIVSAFDPSLPLAE